MTLSSRLTGISAFLLGVSLFYAPLAYGCMRPDMLPVLYALLGAAIAAGLAGMALRGAWPDVPPLALVCFVALMFQGWWMAANPVLPEMLPETSSIGDVTLDDLSQFSFNAMLLYSALLGAFLVLCDMLIDPAWRRFVLMCAALSGVLVSVIGVFLKTKLGAPFLPYIWTPTEFSWYHFAFFHYHGTAGAFLNVVWPLVLVFTRRAYELPEIGRSTRIIWTIASVVCALALFVNASKASLGIGLLILPWPFSSGLRRMQSVTLFLLGLLAALMLCILLFASSNLAHEAAFRRMTNAEDISRSVDGRWQAYQRYLDDLPEAGWFGIGPGLFPVAYPYKPSLSRNTDPALRQYAHEDYLQTTLEWGWVGTVWWSLLVGGGLFRAFHAYAQRERFQSRTDRHLVLAGILGVLATLAQALSGFPLQVPSIRLYFLLLLALCWASPGLLAPPERNPLRRQLSIPPREALPEGEMKAEST